MLIFWVCAGSLAAAAALLLSARSASARRAASRPASEDVAPALYRRQLAEIDAQAAQGLLEPTELAPARAGAGRRLLAEAERAAPAEGGEGVSAGLIAAAAVLAAAVGAGGLYWALGSRGAVDQPYAARLAGWTTVDPSALDPARLAAVLDRVTRRRPGDPQAYEYLGRAQLAAGAPGEAARAFAQAARLAPRNADYPAQEGEALTLGAGGKVEPQAEAAFREALGRDPASAPARFYLGRWKMAQGDVGGGLADWRGLAASLPVGDVRRQALEREIADASAGAAAGPGAQGPSGAEVAAAAATIPTGDQAVFIRGMVDRLAARLQAQPDDVEGWTRLMRAYQVLGDVGARDRALGRARRIYAKRPADLARIVEGR